MKTINRELSVFSTSAVDLFASALGAFILLMLLLFPYYRHAGPESRAINPGSWHSRSACCTVSDSREP